MVQSKVIIKVSLLAIFTVVVGAAATPTSHAYTRPGTTERLSVSPRGEEGDNDSGSSNGPLSASAPIAASPNGRFVAFTSLANNLVAGDGNRVTLDVFVRDLKTDETDIVSHGIGGVPAASSSDIKQLPEGATNPSISGDGRFVAFISDAINLVPGDTNNTSDVFVHDRKLSKTERVSVSSGGDQGNGPSTRGIAPAPAITSNGRFVAFQSAASNLVKDDTNATCELEQLPPALGLCRSAGWDTFVYDRVTRETERVSVTASGGQQDGDSIHPPSISANGRYVLFASAASNIVDLGARPCSEQVGVVIDCHHVYVHDRHAKKHQTELISQNTDGTPGSNISRLTGNQSMSSDGRYVLFESYASNLIPVDKHLDPDTELFVRDRKTNRIEHVSVTSEGEEAQDEGLVCSGASISADGRYVAMSCTYQTAPFPKTLRVFDRLAGAFETTLPMAEGARIASAVASRDARYLFYSTNDGSSLLDLGRRWHVYVRDRGSAVGAQLGHGDSVGEGCQQTSCLGPGVVAVRPDAAADSLTGDVARGGEIVGLTVASRPELADLFFRIDLHRFPDVMRPGVVYGVKVRTAEGIHEIRVVGAGEGGPAGATFGLFSCGGPLCVEQGLLAGGYGTTGDSVVVAVPLDRLGVGGPGEITEIEAFSAIGTYRNGASRVLDSIRLR